MNKAIRQNGKEVVVMQFLKKSGVRIHIHAM